jgi:hypothetical protein
VARPEALLSTQIVLVNLIVTLNNVQRRKLTLMLWQNFITDFAVVFLFSNAGNLSR